MYLHFKIIYINLLINFQNKFTILNLEPNIETTKVKIQSCCHFVTLYCLLSIFPETSYPNPTLHI